VLIHVPSQFKDELLQRVEAVADKLAYMLEQQRKPSPFYEYEKGKLIELKAKSKPKPKRSKG
jgi:hypothetical protein